MPIARKPLFILLFAVVFTVMLFSGCKKEEGTIWVLTEADCSKTITTNGQFDIVVEQFQEKYEAVDVIVERMPLDAEAREIRLQQLRTEIMAGKGPDIFLLPTSMTNLVTDEYEPEIFYLESLFPDVNQAMHNGLFMDISAPYDKDKELDKENLLTTVMDAGVVGEARYALPLRYDIPVIYLDIARLEEFGIDRSIYQQGIVDLMDDVTAYGFDWLAAGADNTDLCDHILNCFPELIDYENQTVSLTREEVLAFLNSYCAREEAENGAGMTGPTAYDHMLWAEDEEYLPYWTTEERAPNGTAIGGMGDVINNVIVSQAKDIEVEMLPLAAMDGSVVAEVTFFGAIGANCENPELAYELLRPMLMEDAQWQNHKVRIITPITYMSEGWPVRARGAGYQVFRNDFEYRYRNRSFSAEKSRVINTVLKDSNVYDEDIEQLFAIDKVRFPISLEFELGITVWQQYGLGNEAIDRFQLEPLVEDFMKKLEWHVAEG